MAYYYFLNLELFYLQKYIFYLAIVVVESTEALETVKIIVDIKENFCFVDRTNILRFFTTFCYFLVEACELCKLFKNNYCFFKYYNNLKRRKNCMKKKNHCVLLWSFSTHLPIKEEKKTNKKIYI